jgi:hypothetical protein
VTVGAATGYAQPATIPGVSPAAGRVRAAAVLANPSTYELTSKSRTIANQQNVECCVSCVLGAAVEILNPTYAPLSPLFHYHVARYEEGNADADGSLFLGDALGTLAQQGICARQLHDPPFSTVGAEGVPSEEAYADGRTRALKRRGIRSRYIPAGGPSTVAWIRGQLLLDRPVALGITLPRGYPDSFLDSRFAWNNPGSAPSSSGHCVLAVGYSDARQALHIQDCRGAESFAQGCWWMGYRVADGAYVKEAYALLP